MKLFSRGSEWGVILTYIRIGSIGGYRKRENVSLAIWATVALALMMAGGIGTGVAPKEIFGVLERFSVFAATGFNAVLGVYLFTGRFDIIFKQVSDDRRRNHNFNERETK